MSCPQVVMWHINIAVTMLVIEHSLLKTHPDSIYQNHDHTLGPTASRFTVQPDYPT